MPIPTERMTARVNDNDPTYPPKTEFLYIVLECVLELAL